MRLYVRPAAVAAMRVAVVMGPVGERLSRRQPIQVLCILQGLDEALEEMPDFLYVKVKYA